MDPSVGEVLLINGQISVGVVVEGVVLIDLATVDTTLMESEEVLKDSLTLRKSTQLRARKVLLKRHDETEIAADAPLTSAET